MLNKGAAEKRFGYHPYCQGLKLTHLSFADGKRQSIEGIINIFNHFVEMSGLHISVEKTTIFLAGVQDTEKQELLDTFAFAHGDLPVIYLGLPLLTKQMTVRNYAHLIEKIRARIGSWTARFLSFAGRLQLIGSVIHSLTNFWISAFKLPRKCIQEIDSLCAAFLWSGADMNTNKAKVSWKDYCRPKEEGGLGLRSLEEANQVSCLKLVWRILSSKNSLWVKWVRRYLIRKGSFWTVKDSSSLGSWMWKKLFKYREVAAVFSKMKVKNGMSTSFWFDDCCYSNPKHKRRRHRVEVFNLIELEILKVKHRGLQSEEDIRLWKCGDDYKLSFTTKETWKLLRGMQARVDWFEGVWFRYSTPRFSFHTWVAILDRLPTGDRISLWNGGIAVMCPLCKDCPETRNHLFFQCKYSGGADDPHQKAFEDGLYQCVG
ncbi:uncharacterized protein LOC125596654 [Brassica napus]|uniref:uncharacterized protein LOC125596654 n=1 Tax=Brassica napus TaxID=3708 RepID=UPI002079092E|nr:uncharacterized protein LOC125596654 [Brassica napus]